MQLLTIFLTVPILAISAALTPRDIMQFATERQRCDREITVDPTAIERARAGEAVTDPEFNCYVGCILQGMNLMGQDGGLNVDRATQIVPNAPFRDSLIDALRSCGGQGVGERCESARRLLACMQDKGVPQMLGSM